MIVLGIAGLVLAAILVLAGVAQAKTAEIAAAEAPPVRSSYMKAELVTMAESVALETNVPPALLKAIIQQESNWSPTAVNPKDPSYGICQVQIPIAIHFGVISNVDEYRELFKPMNGMRAGARFLSELLRKYPFDDAIQMYNLGETKFRNGLRVPSYLAKVKEYYDEFRAA